MSTHGALTTGFLLQFHCQSALGFFFVPFKHVLPNLFAFHVFFILFLWFSKLLLIGCFSLMWYIYWLTAQTVLFCDMASANMRFLCRPCLIATNWMCEGVALPLQCIPFKGWTPLSLLFLLNALWNLCSHMTSEKAKTAIGKNWGKGIRWQRESAHSLVNNPTSTSSVKGSSMKAPVILCTILLLTDVWKVAVWKCP